jgi:hypothetical protein
LPEPTPLSPTLAGLLREDPHTWTLRLLWARMPLPLRQEAVQSVLEDDSAESAPLRASLLHALARAGGFRAKMLEGHHPGGGRCSPPTWTPSASPMKRAR